jgi:hypothetical protein
MYDNSNEFKKKVIVMIEKSNFKDVFEEEFRLHSQKKLIKNCSSTSIDKKNRKIMLDAWEKRRNIYSGEKNLEDVIEKCVKICGILNDPTINEKLALICFSTSKYHYSLMINSENDEILMAYHSQGL